MSQISHLIQRNEDTSLYRTLHQVPRVPRVSTIEGFEASGSDSTMGVVISLPFHQ